MVGEFERNKDTVQELTESAATHIGNIATIITGAIRDIARETGDWLTDFIEMREASRRAQADEENSAAEPVTGESLRPDTEPEPFPRDRTSEPPPRVVDPDPTE